MNHRISLKSVNGCNGRSRFSEVTRKHKPSTIGNCTDTSLSKSTCVCKYQTCLKAMFRMSPVCSNASSKTWMPLLDRFVTNCQLPSSNRCHASFRWCRLCQSSTTILLKCPRLVGKFREDFFSKVSFLMPQHLN